MVRTFYSFSCFLSIIFEKKQSYMLMTNKRKNARMLLESIAFFV